MPTLNLAIYGPGRWAGRLVGAIQDKSDKARFTAAASNDPARHQAFSEKFSIPVTSFDAVLADPAIDGVVLATPHSDHAAQAIAAAEAGKHVFIEKPFALTRADAEAVIAACAKAGVTVGHGFNRRFSPAFIEIRRRVETGELGELLHVEGQFSGPSGFALKPGAWRAGRKDSPAGAMTARGIHPLDAMIAVAGLVKTVCAFSDRRTLEIDIDDVTSALLRFINGVTGYVASHHVTAEIWRLQVYGTKGWMEMRGDTDLTFVPVEGDAETVALKPTDKERAELEAFAEAVAGKASFPVTDAQAINGIAVVEAMVASADSGQIQTID